MGARLLSPRMIWFALLVSQGFYVAIPVLGLVERSRVRPDPILLYALAAVALVVAVVSFVVPGIVRRSAIASAAADLRHREASLDTIQARAFGIGFTPFILSIALSEAIALFGLVLSTLGFPTLVCLPFHAAGAVLTLIRFPTTAMFLGPLEEALGRTLR
jgi:hypothetical protein